MAITVKHSKVSTIPDGTDTSVVRPSDWNDDHVLTGTIPVANGGTGASTLTGYVKGNGTSAMTASATVPSTDVTGLGTMSTQNSNNIVVTGGSMSGVTISDYVATATKGVANGVASLDGSGTVPIAQLPAAVLGALSYQGTWNASTNTPTLTSSVGTKGYYYVVNVAGSTNLNGITDWQIGDWAVYNGSAWQKIDNTDAVTSVNGYTGTVVLTTTDVAEGTNQYFTTARARTSVSAGTGISYDSGTGVITNSSPSLGGDVVGPASSTDNAIARFDTTTGKLIQNSVVTIGDTGATTGITTLSASTSVTTPIVQATNSAGLALKNASGTTQISMGAGGGDNASINVSTNINGTNAQIDISPTGTGHVHINPTGVNSIQINPTYVGTMDNMTIGATTPKNASVVDLSVTGTTKFDGSEGTVGQVLTSAGTGATPTWTTPTTGTVTSVTGTAPVVSSGGATPAISMAAANTTTNGYLTSTDWNTFNGKSNTTGTVTSVGLSAPSIFTVGGSPVTSSGTLALTYSGTALPLANGGTGATSAPYAMAQLMGFTTTATAAGTTTLTNTSSYYQLFTGSTTQTVVLPVTSTLQTGWTFHICNNSSGALTVQSSGLNTVISVIAGTTVMVTCIGTALTTAADWEAGYTDFSTATGTGAVVLGTRPTMSVTGSGFTLQDATDNTKQANFVLSGLLTGTNYTYTLPAVSGASLATLGAVAQTFSSSVTFSSTITANGGLTLSGATGTNASFHTSATTATTTISGASQTGTLTVGRSTVSQQTDIQAGATASGSTKTINFGTGGLAGSTTTIAIGSTAGTSTTTVNGAVSFANAPAVMTNLRGWTTTATAAGTTTLTSASTYQQEFTGTTTQTVVLPVVSTLALGWSFEITNNSTGSLTVNSSGGNLVGTVTAGTTASLVCIAITGTTAASWDFDIDGFSAQTGTGSVVRSVSPTITGTLTASGDITTPVISVSNGLVVNSNTVSASYSIPSGSSASSVGPMTVASGQTVTVASGSRWVVL